ncbi:hypothetical protein CXB51_022637 [Gossypium anomalum]|uniref:RNase H type-1 domain-containing protein n=1 Tax=Gossypium anomalum TaxID=47600 RepID=A0A8J5YW21_9ROSI|nr:hypothetical protein CXB51_022637 [Gossypium anomalum]
MIVWKSKDVPANALLLDWNYASRLFARLQANMVEALAVREALSWLKDKVIAAISTETNCPTVIEACTNPAEDDSEMGIG